MQPLEEDPEISELLGETKPSKKCVQFKVVGNDKESVLRNRKRKNKEHYDQSKKNGQESDTKKQKTGSSGKTNSMLERAKLKLKERYDEEQSKKNDRIIAIIDKDMSKKKSNRHIIEKRKPIDIEKEKTKLEAFTKHEKAIINAEDRTRRTLLQRMTKKEIIQQYSGKQYSTLEKRQLMFPTPNQPQMDWGTFNFFDHLYNVEKLSPEDKKKKWENKLKQFSKMKKNDRRTV